MIEIYSPEFIFSLKENYQKKVSELCEFIKMYEVLINEDNIKPLFSQTHKYDLFPKKKNYKKFKIRNKNIWSPTIAKTDKEKIKKTIKIILNKITEKNYNILIETLICEIGKFNTSDILDILAKEILEKIVYDNHFHNIYIKLCNRIWSMKSWHEELITIIIDENNKLYWHKNSSNDKENKLNGPFDNESDIRKYTDKHINFRYILLNQLYEKFLEKDNYINESNKPNIDEDLRYKYRRNIFGTLEFIGKLYKKNMISEKIIHIIFIELLNYKQQKDQIPEEYIECFCILWKIVYEKIILPIPYNLSTQYFEYIKKNIITIKWPLRIIFMIEDSIEKYEKKYKYDNQIDQKNKENNTLSDIEKIENIIYEFKKSYNYDNTIHKLQKYSKNITDILDIIIYCVVDEIDKNKFYIDLLKNCKFINNDHIIIALDRIVKNIDEILLDIPNAKHNLLTLITSLNTNLNINLKDGIITNIILTLSSD